MSEKSPRDRLIAGEPDSRGHTSCLRLEVVRCRILLEHLRDLLQHELKARPERRVVWVTGRPYASSMDWTCPRCSLASGHSSRDSPGARRNAVSAAHIRQVHRMAAAIDQSPGPAPRGARRDRPLPPHGPVPDRNAATPPEDIPRRVSSTCDADRCGHVIASRRGVKEPGGGRRFPV